MDSHHAVLWGIAKATDALVWALEEPDSVWVERKFKLSLSQAKIVDEAIARCASIFDGGNLAGRAIEFICMLALEEPDIESVTPPTIEEVKTFLPSLPWQEL